MHRQSVERTYDRLSRFYDIVWGKVFHKGRVKAIEYLNVGEGDRILEVGVGTGLSLSLYPETCTIHGIDLSSHMLCIANKRIRNGKEGLSKVFLHRMDGSRLAFKDEQFDGIVAAYVMSATPDPLGMLREMMRVCKKGGKIVFINHFKSENPFIAGIEKAISPVCTRIGFTTDLRLLPLLQESNLEVQRKEGVNIFNSWKVIKCINP